MQSLKNKVIFILGGPGSGKGTQCEFIVKKYNYIHLSAGDLLRQQRKTPGSQYGQIIQKRIDQGKIVPSQITVMLLKKAMENSKTTHKFLIDGFPRNMENYQQWEKIVGKQADVPFVLNFQCSQQTLQKRLLKRSQTSGRSDDNIDIIRKRFHTFKQDTMEVIKFYQTQGKLVTVNSQSTIQEIFSQVSKHFDKLQ